MTTSTSRSIGNGNGPYLSYSPMQYSLTLGTQMPAPFAADQSLELHPQSTTNNEVDSPSSAFTGPLSSHPVSPDQEGDYSLDLASYNYSRSQKPKGMHRPSTSGGTPSSSAAYHAKAMAAGGTVPSLNGTNAHATKAPHDPNNFDPALLSQKPVQDTSRRPSFVDRFFPRLRSSSSFLRSRSKSSLGQYDESSGDLSQMAAESPSTDNTTRGVKRPGSSSLQRESEASNGGANTFPRMVRKKSMELFSTARRKSGMWAREDSDRPATRSGLAESALDEERRLEQMRESTNEPAPKLPELGGSGLDIGVSRLDGEEMFGNIGKW